MRFFSNNHKSGSWDLGGGEPAALDCDCFSAEFREPKELSLSGREKRKNNLLFQMLSSRTVPKQKKPCYPSLCNIRMLHIYMFRKLDYMPCNI